MRSGLSMLDMMLGFVGAIYILIALTVSGQGDHAVQALDRHLLVTVTIVGNDLPSEGSLVVECHAQARFEYESAQGNARLTFHAVSSLSPESDDDSGPQVFKIPFGALEDAAVQIVRMVGDQSESGVEELEGVEGRSVDEVVLGELMKHVGRHTSIDVSFVGV